MEKIDLKIVQLLAKGYKQNEVSKELKNKGVVPNSISIIEKRINKLKKKFNAKTNFHLAVLLTKEEFI
ncbi:hypothetical protein [uncultured Tenacibaculum sp.]|uniref:hypothetical protein n=1 Tax=uncultured Tenacibaculum sp. TaxID=174713 RepID=UPI00260B85B3|nr:hypothetical protein [uncultured Tenacibaculum sp.]